MKITELDETQYPLYFAIKRSIRYHDRRKAYFITLHQITGVLTVLLSGSVIFDLAKSGENPWWLNTIAFISAVLAAWDVVIGYSSKITLHHDLKRRFSELEMKIVAEKKESAFWGTLENERALIERDEPPIYRALDLLCHNELLVAEGFGGKGKADDWREICWFQRLTSQFLRWPNIISS